MKNVANEIIEQDDNKKLIMEYTETNEGQGISAKKINDSVDENIDQDQLITEKL